MHHNICISHGNGKMLEIRVAEGENAQVNEVVCVIDVVPNATA